MHPTAGVSNLPESCGSVEGPAAEGLKCVPQLQLQSPTLLSLKLPARALLGQGCSAAKGPCQGQKLAAPVGKVCALYVLAKERNEPSPCFPFTF
jgi:hypothetical protein